jgi:hypothetical protein
MTRRQLWSVTALACALLALPSLPELPAGWTDAALQALSLLDPRDARIVIAAGATLVAFGALLQRRAESRADLVLALAKRGRTAPAIARRSGLARDAVRDILGGTDEPVVISTGLWGRIFRQRRKDPAGRDQPFSEALALSSFEGKA